MSALLPKPFRSCPKDDGDSPLHIACYGGVYDSALLLILSGEDLMARNVWQETPLHHSTAQGHLDIMLLLLDSGVSVNARDHQNLTPLHQAVMHSNKHASELLLCYGASVHNHPSVTDTLSVLALASHVHVCHQVIHEAVGVSEQLFLWLVCHVFILSRSYGLFATLVQNNHPALSRSCQEEAIERASITKTLAVLLEHSTSVRVCCFAPELGACPFQQV